MATGWSASFDDLPEMDNDVQRMYMLLVLLDAKVDGSALGEAVTDSLLLENSVLVFDPMFGVSERDARRVLNGITLN